MNFQRDTKSSQDVSPGSTFSQSFSSLHKEIAQYSQSVEQQIVDLELIVEPLLAHPNSGSGVLMTPSVSLPSVSVPPVSMPKPAPALKAESISRNFADWFLANTTDAVYIRELKTGSVLDWNKPAETLFGWLKEDVLQKPIDHLVFRLEDVGLLQDVELALLETGFWTGQWTQLNRLGQFVIVETQWMRLPDFDGRSAVMVINRDVTEQKILEFNVYRSARLESIGLLASGLTHDLNNILAPFFMALHPLREKFDPDDDEAQSVYRILESSAKRGANLIKQILAFAKGSDISISRINIKQLFSEIMMLTKETFPKSIVISQEVNEQLWDLSGDLTQIHQVIFNLCINARDAMPNGGSLTLSGSNVTVEGDYRLANGDIITPGNYVGVKIQDTGLGMNTEVLTKMFDPFFTTKDSANGTGLGLATSLMIIRKHQGFLEVKSTPGLGTEFQLYLPALDPDEDTDLPIEDRMIIKGTGQHILVVDDDSFILALCKNILEKQDFRVTITKEPESVMDLLKNGDFQAVIVDLDMPVVSGFELVSAIQASETPLPVLMMSGLPAQDHAGFDETLHKGKPFILKPFNMKVLLMELNTMLSV
ncbi:MAG: ATP-binding protein [Candidatus Margulisiibacteriota bacterium]